MNRFQVVNNNHIQLRELLHIEICPYCGANKPTMMLLHDQVKTERGNKDTFWAMYACKNCGGVVVGFSETYFDSTGPVHNAGYFPGEDEVDDSIPKRAKEYLKQAIASIMAPAGSIMLSAASVDSMLKSLDLKSGSLHQRIKTAADQHLITDSMALWAHQVRLNANEQRHADESIELPTIIDAKRTIEFAKALAEFLFVLPSKVNKGLKESSVKESDLEKIVHSPSGRGWGDSQVC